MVNRCRLLITIAKYEIVPGAKRICWRVGLI